MFPTLDPLRILIGRGGIDGFGRGLVTVLIYKFVMIQMWDPWRILNGILGTTHVL